MAIDYNVFESVFLVCSVRGVAAIPRVALQSPCATALLEPFTCWEPNKTLRDSPASLHTGPCQCLILLAGMVFMSRGFSDGSPEHDGLVAIVAATVVRARVAGTVPHFAHCAAHTHGAP
jgi:hypothetical protein